MEEENRKHAPEELVDVETIKNLDTARMALRWALERERQAARQEDERQARERLRALEQNFAVKSRELEQQHVSKMSALHEKELTLRQDEKLQGEKRAQFEEYYAQQRAELSSQLKQ